MDDKENPDTASGDETTNEESNKRTQNQNDAGPSRQTTLPGEVEAVRLHFQSKTGISKSEHNIRHIITSKDVADALKSLSINAANATTKINEIKIPIPIPSTKTDIEKDPTTFVDLKKFVASCFKVNQDTHNSIILNELPNQNLQASTVITTELKHDVANTSCNPTNILTQKGNEVLITNPKVVEDKASKVNSEKSRKTSGNLSEKSNYAVTQRDSLSSIGSNVCRICMTRGRERLISPCNCKGSMANVHLTCLERWLNQVGRNHCELCGYNYPAIRTPRYTVLQALRLWFGNPRNRSHLQSDCLIFWLLSTVTAGLLAVCIVGTQYFVIEGNKFGKLDAGLRKEEGISHRITETAMDFFMAVVLCGYSVTVYLLWKDHYVMWNRWRRAHVNVRLLLTPDANPVPFVPRPRYNIV
ncbi:hypothetical protein evm_009756 [Chilo suppressalis]|nr:hypothetical protein evm_009756 [Chilo suppressalis]